MKIAYIENGVIVETVFIGDTPNLDFPYVVIDRDIKEPIESWYIEDGEIKIDQEKLAQFNREQMPTLSPIEFDIKLNKLGLYDAVQELIKDNFEMRIAYTRATFFNRLDPFIAQASEVLGLTPEQVDEMWTS